MKKYKAYSFGRYFIGSIMEYFPIEYISSYRPHNNKIFRKTKEPDHPYKTVYYVEYGNKFKTNLITQLGYDLGLEYTNVVISDTKQE